jgi:hypothetical protein
MEDARCVRRRAPVVLVPEELEDARLRQRAVGDEAGRRGEVDLREERQRAVLAARPLDLGGQVGAAAEPRRAALVRDEAHGETRPPPKLGRRPVSEPVVACHRLHIRASVGVEDRLAEQPRLRPLPPLRRRPVRGHASNLGQDARHAEADMEVISPPHF